MSDLKALMAMVRATVVTWDVNGVIIVPAEVLLRDLEAGFAAMTAGTSTNVVSND